MGFPLPTITDTSTSLTGVKRKFQVEGNGMVRARWEDDEGWMKIYSEREWKEMMEWAYEIPAPKDNGDLPCRLIVAVPKKKALLVD